MSKFSEVRCLGLIRILTRTCVFSILSVLLASQPMAAQTLTVLYNFSGLTDGSEPYAGLVRDSDGNLYGTTYLGGSGGGCETGCGTVFKLDPTGKESVLHNFAGGSDGAYPYYGYLLRDAAGNLYGTTSQGGAVGDGIAFRISPAGKEISLSFSGGAKGGFSYAGLISDSAGNFYGTTASRGSFCAPYGCGTAFKISKTGKETVLHSFGNGPDGAYPIDQLVLDSAGNLYGTTQAGGTDGFGTVFKIDASGNETVLYNFTGQDGLFPTAGLIRDSAGNLYGTTAYGGVGFEGNVFKLDASGQETTLYSFAYSVGAQPNAGLIQDSAGYLYGTTTNGGTMNGGIIFKLDASTGEETTLYNFNATAPAPAFPYAGVILDSAGNLYGTTLSGGSGGHGTVFMLSPQ